MLVWMEVTRDEYELPLVVAKSCRELAEKIGTTENAIRVLMRYYRRTGGKCPYIKVEV